jgi:basic membrane protein A
MPRRLALLLLAGLALPLAGCLRTPASKPGPKVALVLSVGGLGDKSFNDLAHEGLERARRELPKLGLQVACFEGQPMMLAEDERYLRRYASRGFDLIVAVGFLMKTATVKVAREFPNVRFAIIDADIAPDENPHKNIASLRFQEHEGSFLVGAAAALASKAGIVGFVGGMEIPLIHKFRLGYEEGVAHIARRTGREIKVIAKFAGSGPEAFSDPVKGKTLAESMFGQGADVVFHAAGSTGNGVIEAARERGKLAIGVDANQDAMERGYVLTSMIKRVDVAVHEIIREVLEKRFKPAVHRFGLEVGGVGVTDFRFMRDPKAAGDRMDPERMARIDAAMKSIREDIINGKIKVANYEELH